jgi:hypothetical protein
MKIRKALLFVLLLASLFVVGCSKKEPVKTTRQKLDSKEAGERAEGIKEATDRFGGNK